MAGEFRTRLEERAGQLLATIVGTSIAIPLPAAVLATRPALVQRSFEELIVGIRPEAFSMAEPAKAMLTADVLVTEALGADSFVFFELPCRAAVTEERLTADAAGRSAVTRVGARIPPHRAPREKQPLPLSVDPQQLHWFDPATGAAI